MGSNPTASAVHSGARPEWIHVDAEAHGARARLPRDMPEVPGLPRALLAVIAAFGLERLGSARAIAGSHDATLMPLHLGLNWDP